jgi:hypothetical protein
MCVGFANNESTNNVTTSFAKFNELGSYLRILHALMRAHLVY